MKATIARFDASYEVDFARPAFSHVGSFAQIIEPIYDALSSEFHIPSNAIKLEDGNTISTAIVTVTLPSENGEFQARLDGFKVYFFGLKSIEEANRARRSSMMFESAILEFMRDGSPTSWKISLPSWLIVEGGSDATEALVRSLTWLSGSTDPFEIGAANTLSHVKFDCINVEQSWAVGITVDKSALPDADLFLGGVRCICTCFTVCDFRNEGRAYLRHLKADHC